MIAKKKMENVQKDGKPDDQENDTDDENVEL